jgi:terminase small subunit / prophage DNA-packing protein
VSIDRKVSAQELGGLLGMSARRIGELAERKIVVKTARGKFDLAASVAGYCGHLREVAAGRQGESDTLDLVTERARLARAQAVRVERENHIAEGALCPVSETVRIVASHNLRLRNRLLAIPRVWAMRIHAAKTPMLVESIVDEAIREALEELADPDTVGKKGVEAAQAS